MGRKAYRMVQRRPALLDHLSGCIFMFGGVMDIRLGAISRCLSAISPAFPLSSPHWIGKLEQHRNWIEPPRKIDVPLRFGWHISLAAAARCAFRLSRAASASGK